MKPTPTPLPDGAKIDDLRWDKRMSIPQLANKVGITRQHMRRICKGERGASIEVQERIAQELNVSLPEIQRGAS